MKKIKLLSLALSILLILSLSLTACSEKDNNEGLDNPGSSGEVNIAVLNGTTGFGIAKLMEDAKNGKTDVTYNVTVETDASVIQSALINGDVDIAALPTNAAAALYNKTEGAIQIVAVNTLGVLYVMTNGVEVNSIEDLRGKTVYAPAQNPAFIFEAICRANGLTPGENITIDTGYAQPADLRAALVSGQVDIAVLPEPMVTIAKSANTDLTVSLDLTSEWEKVYGENSLMQGCIVVRTAWAEARPDELKKFLEDYEASVNYTVSNPKEASELIVSNNIFAGKAPVAEKAIPKCNIVYMDSGDNIAEYLNKFFTALFGVNPKAVGGSIPDSGIYYGK